MDRLRKFWMTGACKQQSYRSGKESSSPLDIANFTSAYILLIVGVILALILLLAEHLYFTFCRRKLRRVDKNGCCSLLSLVLFCLKQQHLLSLTCKCILYPVIVEINILESVESWFTFPTANTFLWQNSNCLKIVFELKV